MKYLKEISFADFGTRKRTPLTQYDIGDYVMLKNMDFVDNDKTIHIANEVKIIGKDIYDMYKVEYIDGWITDIHGQKIDRKMTPEEIDYYEKEKINSKFNI